MNHRNVWRAVLFFVFAVPVFAGEPWDAPPFASDPKALFDAAAKVPRGDVGVVVLLAEAAYSFETDGRSRTVERLVYRVDEQAAVANNSQISALWAPWHNDKPVLAARVITKDGTVHTLDANAVTEAPARESSLDIFSDNRIVRAPLPAVAVGSVVEYTITTDGRSPIEGAGLSGVFTFGGWVPVERTRLILDGPASIQPRILNHSGVEPQVEENDGRRRTIFTTGRRPKLENVEGWLPFDEMAYPYVAFSTGTSWQEIATRYAAIVDEQIAGSDLQKLVKNAIGNAKTPRDIAARVLAAIQKDIRYAGVEIASGSIIPRQPATVLKNKYGDCKDKAVLLVAMLRQAGLTAHVALLRAGYDFDAHQSLPGLGRFNHAIVRLESPDGAIWIDPTDEFARAGELPIVDQGRMALVAAADTTALTRTPELPSTSNQYNETRLITLGEHGKPPVVEITETTGSTDAEQRRYYVNTAAGKYRESMESYAKSYYFAKRLENLGTSDPHDLTTPFRLTLHIAETGSAIVKNGDAVVAMHPGALFNSLPKVLREWEEPQPDDDPKKAAKPRVHDFVFPEPIAKEFTYRIAPPIGYVARTLPEGQTRKLGTTTYTTEYSVVALGVVVAKLRFDSGKRRITAAEYEQTRVAISKLIDEPQIDIGFEMIGQSKLNAGDVAGALAEFRRLAGLHPKEAQHHLEVANALLTGGLGEAAREKARGAVVLEPKNARAHLTLAQVLQHDLIGRKFHKGWDRKGALEALRKAKELDSENIDVRIELARLLSYGTEGLEFGAGAQLADSAAEYRALAKDFGDKGRAQEGELMLVLAHAGKFGELKELSATVEDAQRRNTGRLIAIAATEGKEGMLRELRTFALDTRRTYAEEITRHLINLRYYPEAAAAMELAKQGSAEAQSSAFFIDVLKKTRRAEEMNLREDDPLTILPRMIVVAMNGTTENLLALLAPDVREEAKKELEEEEEEDPFAALRNALTTDEFSRPAMADLMTAMQQGSKDGNDATGYRVRHRLGEQTITSYVTKEDGGKYLLRAMEDDESLGHAALRFLGRGEVDHARIWLNWGRETTEAGDAEDPLSRRAFAMLWPKAKATATAEEVRLAAAAFVAEVAGDDLEALAGLREKAATDAVRLAIDLALSKGHAKKKEWAKALAPARRLYDAHPDSATAFNMLGTALSGSGNYDEAAALAKARLEKMPKDVDALRRLGHNAAARRDYQAAEAYAQQLLDETAPMAVDFNNAAWYGLFTGNLERALAHAMQATAEKSEPDGLRFHTLASLYAEADKPLEARQALLTSMIVGQRDQPDSADWYVLGRIAETYGVRDAAAAAYKRVATAKENDHDADITELVARRVAKWK